MAVIINGIKYSYDYSSLIDEIMSDIQENFIDSSGNIYILRDENILVGNYHVVIDYYFIDTEEEINEGLLEGGLFGEYDDDVLSLKKDWEENKDKLEVISVQTLLEELKSWNEIV